MRPRRVLTQNANNHDVTPEETNAIPFIRPLLSFSFCVATARRGQLVGLASIADKEREALVVMVSRKPPAAPCYENRAHPATGHGKPHHDTQQPHHTIGARQGTTYSADHFTSLCRRPPKP